MADPDGALRPTLLQAPDDLLDGGGRHLFFTGKGGVGKTSHACALIRLQDPLLAHRAGLELPLVRRVRDEFAEQVALVPHLTEAPMGTEGLRWLDAITPLTAGTTP